MHKILKQLNDLIEECARERNNLISANSAPTSSDFVDIPEKWYVYNRMLIDLAKIQNYAQKDLKEDVGCGEKEEHG